MPKLHIETNINGDPVEYLCEPHETMLSVLRETLGMTGTKEGCGTEIAGHVQSKSMAGWCAPA